MIYMCIRLCIYTHWRRRWQPTPGLPPGKSHGRGAVGCSPCGHDWAISLHSLHALSLEKEMATLSSILAWRIPWTEEPGGHGPCVAESWTRLQWLGTHIFTHMHACVPSCFGHVWLCDPRDCSPAGFSVWEILQARTLQCIAMPSSRGPSRLRDRTCISCCSCLAGGFFAAEPRGRPRAQNPLLDYTLVMAKGLCDSAKLWAMPCNATQGRWVTVKSSDKMWSTGEQMATHSSILVWITPWAVWKAER